jgi:hypothetical protein
VSILHYTADDLVIMVNVTFEPDAEIQSLTGGTVEARAKSGAAPVINASSCTITATDKVRVVFSDGVLPEGVYTLQVRATVSGNTQTIAEEQITVRPSL